MMIRHLSYFVALARERHFARAAAVCNVTQPTLTVAIQKLEADLEARLVVRSHRYVGLTHEGEHVLAWAQQILADYDSLRVDLGGLKKGLEGTLRLGVIPAAMASVAFVTEPFCSAHPAAKVSVQSMNSRDIQRGLNAFEIDAGLTYLDNEPLEHARTVPLYLERYIFVTRRGGRHEGRSTITWKEAAGERLCLLSEDMQNRRIINKIVESTGVPIDPTITGNSFLNILSHLRQGGWSSIVPHIFSFIIGDTPDLLKLDLVEPVHSQAIGLVLSDRDPLSPMTSALVAAVTGVDFERELARAMGREA
jgi:DNA-binding transcriptional LysR family regulator